MYVCDQGSNIAKQIVDCNVLIALSSQRVKMDNPPNSQLSKVFEQSSIDQRFRALVLATSDVIYRLSADWEIMQELDGRGFLRDALKPTRSWKDINVFSEDMHMLNQAISQAKKEKKIFALEHRVNRADGSIGWTYSRAIPILNDEGEILEWLGAASDISARKEAEIALEESRALAMEQQRKYETITSGTPDLMYVFDLDYRFTYANEALLAMWGKSAQEAIGKGLLDNGYEPWHAQMHQREIDQVVSTGMPIRGEVSFPHAELGSRVYDYIFTPVIGANGKIEAVAGTTRDVTDIRNTMKALERTSMELQSTVEDLARTNRELLAANQQLRALNAELQEARKQVSDSETVLRQAIDAANFGTWFIHPQTREFVTDVRVRQLLGFYPHEQPTLDEALERVSEDYRKGVKEKLDNAMYNNGDYEVICPVIGMHDQKLRWVRAVGNLTADAAGSITIFTGLLMDITEQHNDEIRKNDFIAMVSHELKTPLTSLKAYIQVVLRKLKTTNEETVLGAMEKANQQVGKMTNMINGFLNLSRLESGKISINYERFDFANLMQAISEEISTSVSTHEIVFAPVEGIILDADQDKISQVIQNFISNAIKYSPYGSRIDVSCEHTDEELILRVADQGMGISKQDLGKVFDRYFRVEDVKLGTIAGFGIGLYICSEIISRHGGKIWVESEINKGSIFTFSLPLSQ